MMAGLLLARAGVRTLVLEKHADFLRDFRGDTVHPSTLEVIHELGLLEAFLARPHDRLVTARGAFGGRTLRIADFSRLPTACGFIAMVPQWHFLDFLASTADALPGFSLAMNAEAEGLLETGGRVTGLCARIDGSPRRIAARLVIGADGRGSRIREAAGLARREIGAPIDVLWFRVPRKTERREDEALFNAGRGHVLVTIDRGDYFQCAFVIRKGGAEAVRARGLEAFRQAVVATVPRFAEAIDALASFDDVSLLTVRMDRLERWARPGLLMIGDAAHAMSPVGGVGINLAIQDAVAAANLFAAPLAAGALEDDALDALQRRREGPVRVTQRVQSMLQDRLVLPLLDREGPAPAPPLPLRIVSAIPLLQRVIGRAIGLGVRPEHVRSPARHPLGDPGDDLADPRERPAPG